LETTAVAVLLVSPDFLASDYIRKFELPLLLRAREEGQLDLACLYLRPSSADEDDMAFEIALSSGATVRAKLTKYQGLNSPGAVLSLQDKNNHDTVYLQAAADIKKLLAQRTRTVAHSSPGKRFELTVQFKRNSNELTRIFSHQYGRFIENRTPWLGSGQAVFDVLFGSPDQCAKVLGMLFESKDLPRPIRYPVRVRLHTDAPELANFPWAEATWEGNLLRDHGWTFELINDKTLHNLPNTTPGSPVVELKAPCPVLMIAPSTAPDAEGHHRAVEERLKRAWPSYHEPPQRVVTWKALEQAWERRKPRIVYYYGPAESDGKTLTLSLDGPQGIDRRPVSELAQLWQADPPQIVFCNLVGEQVSSGMALSELNVSLAITQNGVDPAEARRAALAWLYELLEGHEDTDPVWALSQHGLKTAVAWGAYGTWRTRTIVEAAKDKLIRLLLDRKQQRALGHDAVRELVRDGERRVCSVLAYGAEGNLAALFAEQLYEHLRRNVKEVAYVYRLPLRLPPAPSFDGTKLEFEVRRQLGVSDCDSLGTALAQRAPRGPGRARPVLLLDWGVRGTTVEDRLSIAGLEAWLVFNRQQLCTQCPKELRILSCLALELAIDRHTILEQTVNNRLREARFRDRAFRLELLPRLDKIEANQLADFLDGPENSTCPDDLIPVMPELIINQTDGLFQRTVELIELAERTSWYGLYDSLKAQSRQPNDDSIAKDDLL
jgi:hypothetical protein